MVSVGMLVLLDGLYWVWISLRYGVVMFLVKLHGSGNLSLCGSYYQENEYEYLLFHIRSLLG